MKVGLADAQSLQGEAQFQAYACLDTTGTREVFDVLKKRLDPETERVYRWCLAQQSPAVTMTLRGVRVDPVALKKAKTEVSRDLAAAIYAVQTHKFVVALWDVVELNSGDCEKGPPRKSGKPAKHVWPRRKVVLKDGEVQEVIEAPPVTEMRCTRCGAPRQKIKEFNPASVKDTAHLLYDLFKLPKQRNKDGGITTDDDALAKLIRKCRETQKRAAWAEVLELLQTCRDLAKQQGFLNARLRDDRFYSSFNVGAAWTGRFSSSKDPFQDGGNLQNIGERHRHIFVADPGKKLFYADLKTAESLLVAYLSGEEKYIEAHKGDVHTFVCREVWDENDDPRLLWTGDIKQDKLIATSAKPSWDDVPGHDYRFQSKRVQHGSNYGLTPFGMAILAKIPVEAAKAAQNRYFSAFPLIREWQNWTRARIRQHLPLRNPLGRVIRLFGRPDDEHTHKQGFAFSPQSAIADILNLGLWRVWNEYDPHLIQLLAQIHDAIKGQFDEAREMEAVRALKRLMEIPVPVTDIYGVTRVCTIPVEIATGWNWGKRSETNPRGIQEVKL